MCLWCVWDLVSFHVSFRRFVSSLVAVDAACGVPGLRWLLVPGIAGFLLKRSVVKRNERNVLRKERLKTDRDRLFCRRLFLSYTTLIISFHLIYLNLAKSTLNVISAHINIQFNVCSYHNRCFSNEMKIKTCENKHMERWELWYAAVHSDTWWCRYVSDIDQIFIRYVSGHIRSIITYMVWYS